MTNYNMNQLASQVKFVLEKYDYNFQDDNGILANLQQWQANKNDLLETLRKHPNWSEQELAVICDVEVDNKTKLQQADIRNCVEKFWRFFQGIENERDALKLATPNYNNHYCIMRQLLFNVDESGPLVLYSPIIESQRVVNYIKEELGIKKCAVGQKRVRIISKICQKFGYDKLPTYNKVFTALADALSVSPKLNKYKAVLSVHPCDFLEMSNGNSWNSCHRLEGGEYATGTLSYMNDGVSLVFYTVKLDVDSDFYKQPKIMRQMFHYGNGVLLQSRLYPCNDNHLARNKFLEIVQEIFTDCLDNRLGWAKVGDWYLPVRQAGKIQQCYVKVGKMSLHYEDYDIASNNILVNLNLDVYDKFDKYGNLTTIFDFIKPLEIGSRKVYCIECGEDQLWEHSEYLTCQLCGEGVKCENCRERIMAEDAEVVNGEHYCQDCYEEHFYACDGCGVVMPREEVYSAYWQYANGERCEEWVCNDCLDIHYVTCHHCDEFFRACSH